MYAFQIQQFTSHSQCWELSQWSGRQRQRRLSQFRAKPQRSGNQKKKIKRCGGQTPKKCGRCHGLTTSNLFPTSSFFLWLRCGGWTREVYLLPASFAVRHCFPPMRYKHSEWFLGFFLIQNAHVGHPQWLSQLRIWHCRCFGMGHCRGWRFALYAVDAAKKGLYDLQSAV